MGYVYYLVLAYNMVFAWCRCDEEVFAWWWAWPALELLDLIAIGECDCAWPCLMFPLFDVFIVFTGTFPNKLFILDAPVV